VANQNEGTSILAEGAITLVTGFLGGGEPVTQTVRLNGFDDGYLLNNQVHLPLTKNAMTYWSKVIPDLGWDKPGGLIDQYNPAIALDPEFFAFNHDGSELYLNLQDNSALARVETATGTVKSIHGFGAKPMNQGTGVDIVDDGECKLVTSPCLYLNRAPDGIATVEYEGVNYILTAEEGSDYGLGDFEEKHSSQDVFLAGNAFSFPNFTFSAQVEACRANFEEGCNADWCSNFDLTIGSLAVDYSNPSAPRMDRVVGIGGRGMGIFRLSDNPEESLTMVFDSVS
jgi:hypothetical protein